MRRGAVAWAIWSKSGTCGPCISGIDETFHRRKERLMFISRWREETNPFGSSGKNAVLFVPSHGNRTLDKVNTKEMEEGVYFFVSGR